KPNTSPTMPRLNPAARPGAYATTERKGTRTMPPQYGRKLANIVFSATGSKDRWRATLSRMLAVCCPTHGRRVMVPETRIRYLRNTDDGIQLEVECWCGARVTVHTGRNRARDPGRSPTRS